MFVKHAPVHNVAKTYSIAETSHLFVASFDTIMHNLKT